MFFFKKLKLSNSYICFSYENILKFNLFMGLNWSHKKKKKFDQ